MRALLPTRCVLSSSQAVARQGADSVSVRLSRVDTQSQAQLDGFKSRALRSNQIATPLLYKTASTPPPQDLYMTKWRSLDAAPAGQLHQVFIRDFLLGRGVSPCIAQADLDQQGCRSEIQLIQLRWDESKKVGAITLNDPAHFNALGGALASHLAEVLQHACTIPIAQGFMIQAVGPHFCVGGNPHDKHVDIPVAQLANHLLATARSCWKLRELLCPVTAAVHGHLAGGGIALCLSTSYRAADMSTTFEHGNLPRGVCPIAEFSQTLVYSVGMLADSQTRSEGATS